MADLMNFSIVRNGARQGTIPLFEITCDIMGANGLVLEEIRSDFPAIFNEFSAEEQQELLEELATRLILKKAEKY